ncbi:nucleoside deaminase [Cerasicoccus maritimus]|uniref:nucleoside deaminase n=1 Tax=Cerasicoccus maritimus TaxID=490089 RepID=UPI0028528FC6|nr:nucleoside deaminase [Cerasicoccus maritimus]
MNAPDSLDYQPFLDAAIAEAQQGLAEGGIPIGSVLVLNTEDGPKIVGRGHNQRVQQGSAIRHGEMDALENAGRLTAKDYQNSFIVTTLSPCPMCTGAILLYKIPTVVIGENETFLGAEETLIQHGVRLVHLESEACKQMMRDFIAAKPELWNEDIGV